MKLKITKHLVSSKQCSLYRLTPICDTFRESVEVKYLIAFNICILSHTQVTRVTGAVEKLKEEHFVSKVNVGRKNETIFKLTNPFCQMPLIEV